MGFSGTTGVVHFNENSEANARAAMLAYFIENKLIPLPAQRNSVWRKSLGRLKMSLGHLDLFRFRVPR